MRGLGLYCLVFGGLRPLPVPPRVDRGGRRGWMVAPGLGLRVAAGNSETWALDGVGFAMPGRSIPAGRP